ncbi:hypothetical protein DFAR_2210093 [Desulfarculales bacterium]
MELLNRRGVHAMVITHCKENGNLPEFAPEREISMLIPFQAGQ